MINTNNRKIQHTKRGGKKKKKRKGKEKRAHRTKQHKKYKIQNIK